MTGFIFEVTVRASISIEAEDEQSARAALQRLHLTSEDATITNIEEHVVWLKSP